MPEEKVEAVKGLTITADGNGVVFDVATEDLDTYLAGREFRLNHPSLVKSMSRHFVFILFVFLTQSCLCFR